MIERSIQLLSNYVLNEGFKGYDPYDTLNSWFPFDKFGNRIATYAIQFQKLNPINIRGGIGIRKEYNPKGIGLLLKAFCVLHKSYRDSLSKHQADTLFNWLKTHPSKHYKLPCWGYNFDWATLDSYLEADTPSVVVTSFVVDGLWEYYKLSGNEEAKNMILGAAKWIKEYIPVTVFDSGISYAYTAQSKGACYNASLLAAEVLAKADKLSEKTDSTDNVNKAIDFVLSKQKENGAWWYSYNPIAGTERKQIDFHQGFVLMSLRNLNAVLPEPRTDIEEAIVKKEDSKAVATDKANAAPTYKKIKIAELKTAEVESEEKLSLAMVRYRYKNERSYQSKRYIEYLNSVDD